MGKSSKRPERPTTVTAEPTPDVEFVTELPPPKQGRAARTRLKARAALNARPLEWAIIDVFNVKERAYYLTNSIRRDWGPNYEAATRSTGDGEWKVFARWVEQ